MPDRTADLMLIATLIHWDRFSHGHAPLTGALGLPWLGGRVHRLTVCRALAVVDEPAYRLRRARARAREAIVPESVRR
jgi:hypothetical protein